MNKKELINLIKELGKLDNIEKQMETLAKYKNQITEVNYRLAQNIIAMYNGQVIFKNINYTEKQFQWAYNLLQ